MTSSAGPLGSLPTPMDGNAFRLAVAVGPWRQHRPSL